MADVLTGEDGFVLQRKLILKGTNLCSRTCMRANVAPSTCTRLSLWVLNDRKQQKSVETRLLPTWPQQCDGAQQTVNRQINEVRHTVIHTSAVKIRHVAHPCRADVGLSEPG